MNQTFPPVWAMMEHVPMGAITFYYEGLPVGVQQALANTFFIRPSVFIAILMTLKNARNICAHHSRLWNRHMKARISRRLGASPSLAPFVECLERQPTFTYTTTFTVLSLCAYCMGIIRPESKWKSRCRELLKTATNVANVASVANPSFQFPIGNIGYWLLATFPHFHDSLPEVTRT